MTAAGAALDAEVARRVFGLTDVGEAADHDWPIVLSQPFRQNIECRRCGQVVSINAPVWIKHGPPKAFGRCIVALPSYSTDIAAAWLVVEQMRALNYSIEIEDLRRYQGKDGWNVEFGALGTEPRRDGWAFDVSIPLTICRAALEAVSPLTAPGAAPEGERP